MAPNHQLVKGELQKYEISYHLEILCDLFGMVKWHFSMVKWPPTGGWKGPFESPGMYRSA